METFNFNLTEDEADILVKALNSFSQNLITKLQTQYAAQTKKEVDSGSNIDLGE